MNKTLERLKDIERNGYKIDFGNVFNDAFENYKKIALYAGLIFFVAVIIFCLAFGTFFKTYLNPSNLENINKQLLENLEHQTNLDASLASFILSIAVIWLLLTPFSAGFYKMTEHANHDKEFKFRHIFYFYQSPYFFNIIILTILIGIISMIVTAPIIPLLSILHISNPGLIMLTNYGLTFLIHLFTLFSVPLIVFGNLNAVESLKYSFILAFKQPFVLAALLLVSIIGWFAGFFACCIGMFFTAPFLYSMNYAIYSSIVGIDTPEEIDQ